MGCGCGGAGTQRSPKYSAGSVTVTVGAGVTQRMVFETRKGERILLDPGNTSQRFCVPQEDVAQFPEWFVATGETC